MSTTTTVYTLVHVADRGETNTFVYGSHAEVWAHVAKDVREAAANEGTRVPRDPADWLDFVRENGWKVDRYDLDEHTVTTSDARFDMTPAPVVLCGACQTPIVADDEDRPDEWTTYEGGFDCPAKDDDDHAPAGANEKASI